MSKVIDITGQTFGNITILKRVESDKDGRAQFLYRCACGKEKVGRSKDIRNGRIISCGCQKSKNNRKDITGQQYGELTALRYIKSEHNKAMWEFQCSCGNITEKPKTDVVAGKIKSCGCKTNLWRSQAHRILETPGTVYGFLQIEEPNFTENDMGDSAYWCTCLLCGKRVLIKSIALRTGNTKSCGCLHSYKEQEIVAILDKHNIAYQREKTFSDLLSPAHVKLRFDFALFKNTQLVGLIEYQGIQHFQDQGLFGKEQREVTDKLKVEYCKTNNIPLLILDKNSDLEIEILKFYEVM